MSRRAIILSLSSAAAVALVAVSVVAFTPVGAIAHGRWGGPPGFAGHGPWGGAHGPRALCSDQRDERLSAATGFVEAFVSFTPEQEQSWTALKAALAEGSAKIGAACESAGLDKPPATAPEKLALAELALTTGSQVVHDVRPAFDAFYAKLSAEQRARLDGLLSKRGRRHH